VIEVVVLLLHVLVAAGICLLVLLQHGKGADVGAAFGSGASGSLFGASGSANFLSRSTAVLAGLFFLTSLGLTWLHYRQPRAASVMDSTKIEQPAAPAPGTAGAPAPASVPVPAQGGTPDDSKAKDIPK
jgi:preprotein translocase subunit SecG